MSPHEGVDTHLIFGDAEAAAIVFTCGGEIFTTAINITHEVFGIGFMSAVNFLKFSKRLKDFIFYMLLRFENISGVRNYTLYFSSRLIAKFLMPPILHLKTVSRVNGTWMCATLPLCCSELGAQRIAYDVVPFALR